jgi:UDPglucose 6-dehydrogenase
MIVYCEYMKITLIGTGFVGVVSAVVYASLNHDVFGLDIDQTKITSLNQGIVPFYEPDLEDLLKQQLQAKNLTFSASYQDCVTDSDLVIVAVGTPSAPDGQADLTYVYSAVESAAPYLKKNAILAIKSTVPPGTLNNVEQIIKKKTNVKFATASLPEFLREGSAVKDTINPDRIVIGATNPNAIELLKKLHEPFQAPILVVSPESAQMGKYSANAYLATRITFINQISDLCQKNGANIQEVIQIIGKDKRIGEHYWYPGLGYGGSCFPKDLNELAAYSRSVDEDQNLLNKITQINEDRIPRLMNLFLKKIGTWNQKKVAVLGLSFKPNTNDMREAPSTKIIPILLRENALVSAFDPQSLEVADHFLPSSKNLQYFNNISATIKNADVIMVLVEWPEIIMFDFPKVANNSKVHFIDARNQFDSKKINSLGYEYQGIGV